MSLMGEIGDKKMFLDSVFAENKGEAVLVLNEKYQDISKNLKSTLFSRGRMSESFFTEDSKLYITPKQQKMVNREVKTNNGENLFDGVSARIVGDYRKFRASESDFLYKKLSDKYKEIQKGFIDIPQNFARRMTLVKLWNLSVVGAIVLGMVSMTFIYRYLGVGVSAIGDTNKVITTVPVEQVLGGEDIKNSQDIVSYVEQIIEDSEKIKKDEFEKRVADMVEGYPIKKMLPYLFEKDRTVVAFYIAIAKKESNWGKRVPVLKGEDCYNYLGYRAVRERMGSGGHTCFDSPKDAVNTITKRMEFLIEEKKLDTPAKMSIWKCGSKCDEDGQVKKWISDVESIQSKLKD
jgi:hypothetical protein